MTMTNPEVLVFAGSLRTGSHNEKLAVLAARALRDAGGSVTKISLADYPLPIYDADLERNQGLPESAIRLKEQFLAHAGVFLIAPEYNAGVTPLMKNALDWVSRRHLEDEAALAAFRNRAFAIGSASPGGFGGLRGLLMLRQILAVGTGAMVIPEQVTVSGAGDAFDEAGNLTEETRRKQLDRAAAALVAMAAHYA
jgi:chromate reductase, NAD(P)H dehydrogenase (quinone)